MWGESAQDPNVRAMYVQKSPMLFNVRADLCDVNCCDKLLSTCNQLMSFYCHFLNEPDDGWSSPESSQTID